MDKFEQVNEGKGVVMKIRNFILIAVSLFITQDYAFAGVQLNRAEILQIFKTLTDQPKRTWIPSGTITAAHHEYKKSTGCMTESTVTVKYDGDRFYLEINIDSRTKQHNDKKLSKDDFDLKWNKRRVFVWDGERYTMYFKSGNYAIIQENPSDIPVVVSGPLTAGIIPWGYGIYTLEELSAAETSAIIDTQGHIHLTIERTGTPKIVLVLDPTKDYALLSCSMNYPGGSSATKIYGGYETVSGKWIPTTIIIERHNDRTQPPELLSRDYWDFTSVSPILPQTNSFRVPYETDALVEFYSPISKKPFWYRHYSEVDTESLLQKKLEIEIASTEETPGRNCATVAMKQVLERLGKNITDQQLAGLVSGPDKSTSLYALRQFARDIGLHCRAVKTNLRALKNLKNCQAILHLPRANHYVVFEYIDDKYVWVIDLDSNQFFYRTKLKDFGLTWSEGTALLVSDKPLAPEPNDILINDNELNNIIGSTEGGIPNFSCKDRIQAGKVIKCSGMMGGICASVYRQYWQRCGCMEDEQGSGCWAVIVIGAVSCPCIEDIENPGYCEITGVICFSQPIRACLENCWEE